MRPLSLGDSGEESMKGASGGGEKAGGGVPEARRKQTR